MAKRLNDIVDVRIAVADSAGGAPQAIVATKINGTGFGRARFIFHMGSAATTASLQAGLGVWQAATSGATYALITSAAAVTSGVLSGGAQNTVVIDVPIASSAPWLQLSGGTTSTGVVHGAVVELYDGIDRPPTQSANQVVVA